MKPQRGSGEDRLECLAVAPRVKEGLAHKEVLCATGESQPGPGEKRGWMALHGEEVCASGFVKHSLRARDFDINNPFLRITNTQGSEKWCNLLRSQTGREPRSSRVQSHPGYMPCGTCGEGFLEEVASDDGEGALKRVLLVEAGG